MNQMKLYSIFCITENKIVEMPGFEDKPPTTCYNNYTHEVNPDSLQVIRDLNPHITTASDSSPDDAVFQLQTFNMTIPANTALDTELFFTLLFPFDLYLWTLKLSQKDAKIGDIVTVEVAPDEPIGALTQPVTTGSNKMYVSPTVIPNIVRGSDIGFMNSSSYEKKRLGIVSNINKDTSEVTLEKNFEEDYLSGTYITLTNKPIKNYIFEGLCRMEIGNKGLKTKLLPANKQISIRYTNKNINDSDNELYLHLEYYFK